MLDSFLRQVTKDSYGPISFQEKTTFPVIVHKFHEAISVLNWGKMPDPLLDRGRINALVFSKMNEKFLSVDAWRDFLRSPDALAFRKAGASIQQSGNVSATLNELAEKLPIHSTYLGAVDESHFKALDVKTSLTQENLIPSNFFDSIDSKIPMIYPVSEYIAEEKVPTATVMGRAVWDYSIWKNQAGAKSLPFELLCHFTLTEASLKKLNVDSVSLPKTASLSTLQAGTTWDFPVIELVLPQDPFERRMGLSQAMWVTGFSPDFLQKTLLSAAWIAAFARYYVRGMHLNSVKLRFALDAQGRLMLHDSFTLDDLHFEKDGKNLHSDAAIDFYQKTSWYENAVHAKQHAETFGLPEWKKHVAEPAPFLDPKFKLKLESELQEVAKQFLGK